MAALRFLGAWIALVLALSLFVVFDFFSVAASDYHWPKFVFFLFSAFLFLAVWLATSPKWAWQTRTGIFCLVFTAGFGAYVAGRVALDRRTQTVEERIRANTKCAPVVAYYLGPFMPGPGMEKGTSEYLGVPYHVCRAHDLARLVRENPRSICNSNWTGTVAECFLRVTARITRDAPFNKAGWATWFLQAPQTVASATPVPATVAPTTTIMNLAALNLSMLEKSPRKMDATVVAQIPSLHLMLDGIETQIDRDEGRGPAAMDWGLERKKLAELRRRLKALEASRLGQPQDPAQ